MSTYQIVETEFRDKECLVQALKDLGFDPRVHATPMALSGRRRGGAGHFAEITISCEQTGTYMDVGFERGTDDVYRVHVDRDAPPGATFTARTVNALKQRYAVEVLRRQAKAKGYSVREEPIAGGRVKLTLKRY